MGSEEPDDRGLCWEGFQKHQDDVSATETGSRAREPRAVLGTGPDQAAQRASVRACCHRVEALLDTRELRDTPRPPLGPSPVQGASVPGLQA